MRENIWAIKNFIRNPDKYRIDGFKLDVSSFEDKMEILNEVTLLNVFKNPASLNDSLTLILGDSSKKILLFQ